MASMRAIEIKQAGTPFELVQRERPTPGAGEVLVRVQACGVCHSDAIAKEPLSRDTLPNYFRP